MVPAEHVKELLSKHGEVRPQPPDEWTGTIPLPPQVERFYREVGPVDVWIRSYGNPYFLPRLAGLWDLQTGYRWNLAGEPDLDRWNDDWLVVANEGGDPFILSRASGRVLYALRGAGVWQPQEMFADLNTMAACLAHLGEVVTTAGATLTDEECLVRPRHRRRAIDGLRHLLGTKGDAELLLIALGWDSDR